MPSGDDSEVGSEVDTSSRDDLGPDFDKGLMSLQNKDYEDAVNHFSRSLERNENDEDIAYNLACCFSRLKDVNQGLYWLDRSIAWGLTEGNPDKDADLKFLKTKDKARFGALIAKFKHPGRATPDPKIARVMPPSSIPDATELNAQSVTLSRSKRASTGSRMATLVGEEAEADNEFW